MKHKFAASAALFLFALALFAGTSAYMLAVQASPNFTGESVYGDASAAEGITVEQRAHMDGHITWELSYDAGQMSGESEDGWSRDTVDGDIGNLPGIRTWSNYYFHPDTDAVVNSIDRSMRALYDHMIEKYGEDGYAHEEVDLIDFCDSYPVTLDSLYYNVFTLEGDNFIDITSDELRIPVTEGMTADVGVSAGGISVIPLTFYTDSDSVYVPGGYIYMVAAVTSAETGEVLDGWTLYRLPAECEEIVRYDRYGKIAGQDEAVADSRWWFDDGFGYNFMVESGRDALETVCELPDAATVAALDVSWDGESVLVYTEEDGALYMTVIDAATGAERQRVRLFETADILEPGETIDSLNYGAMSQYASESCAVFCYDDRAAAVFNYVGGEYAPAYTIELNGALPASFAGDSTRLCALLFEPDGRYTGNYRLEVYEDGALSCRQRLSGAHPENSRYASKDTRVYMDGESLGLSRFGSN